jgi:hypothetical protein
MKNIFRLEKFSTIISRVFNQKGGNRFLCRANIEKKKEKTAKWFMMMFASVLRVSYFMNVFQQLSELKNVQQNLQNNYCNTREMF